MLNVKVVVKCEIVHALALANFGLIGARARREMLQRLAKLIVVRRDIKHNFLLTTRNADRDQVNDQIV